MGMTVHAIGSADFAVVSTADSATDFRSDSRADRPRRYRPSAQLHVCAVGSVRVRTRVYACVRLRAGACVRLRVYACVRLRVGACV